MARRGANHLGALGLALADRLAEATATAGSSSAAGALVTLHAHTGGRSIDALARVVGLSHSGTVRLADRLAAAGLAERRPGADQRSTALHLTPAGHRAARQVLSRREAAMQSVLDLLTDDQERALGELAATILAEFGAMPDAERRVCRLCDRDACGGSRGECPVAPRRRSAASAERR